MAMHKKRFEVLLKPNTNYGTKQRPAITTTGSIVMVDNKSIYGEVEFKDVALADAVANLLNEKCKLKR